MENFKSGPMNVMVQELPGGRKALEISHDVWDDLRQAWQTVRWGVTAKGELAALEGDAFIGAVAQLLSSGLSSHDLEFRPIIQEGLV